MKPPPTPPPPHTRHTVDDLRPFHPFFSFEPLQKTDLQSDRCPRREGKKTQPTLSLSFNVPQVPHVDPRNTVIHFILIIQRRVPPILYLCEHGAILPPPPWSCKVTFGQLLLDDWKESRKTTLKKKNPNTEKNIYIFF